MQGKQREREREKNVWLEKTTSLQWCRGSGTASSDTVDSGATGSGAANNEKGSIVGMKMGRERKENVKKERKKMEEKGKRRL